MFFFLKPLFSVIDFCLTKNLVCDFETNYTSLQLHWASKANCKQRKGKRINGLNSGLPLHCKTEGSFDFWPYSCTLFCVAAFIETI